MEFQPNQLYHIYNRGNNHRYIFPQQRNYLFFLNKMRKELAPFCDFISYCLMPNHFHWLIYTKPAACDLSNMVKPRIKKPKLSNSDTDIDYQQQLAASVGILLRSYTRAINKQEDWTGSLFQKGTKAKDGWDIETLITISQESTFLRFNDRIEYARICFNYIHQNPVKAGLVQHPSEWLFSSAQDYNGQRNGTLCNQTLAKNLGII